MTKISPFLNGIPVVKTTTERDARFPSPSLNQRVHNLQTGAIERWNASSWVQDFLNLGTSTGTPAVHVNGVEVLALPQVIDFIGRATGTVDGVTAEVNLPQLAAENAAGVVVAIPTAMKYTGSGVAVTAGIGADAGKAVVAITAGGSVRGDVQLLSSAILTDAVEEGVIDVGALSALLHVLSIGKCWVRLYSTAADRTSDNARLQSADPTTPIILDVIVDTDLDFDLWPIVMAANLDAVATNDLYYSVTQLEETYGAFAQTAEDDVTDSPPVSDVDLNARVPTDPLLSGWTAWECDPVDAYVIWATYGGIRPDAATILEVARSNVDFDHGKIRLTADIYRLSVDQAGEGCSLALFCPDTAMGVWTYDNYLRLAFNRASVNTIDVNISHIQVGGAIVVLDSALGLSMATSSGLRLIVEVIGNTVNLYTADYNTGASKTLRCTATVPSLIVANQRIGVQSSYVIASSGYNIESFVVDQGAGAPAAVDLTFTRTQLETTA